MIEPTVGRVVWYQPTEGEKAFTHNQPFAATVTHVWSNNMVNLAIVREAGEPFKKTSVTLAQDRETRPGECGWMPYQVGQAKKHADEAVRATEPKTAAEPNVHNLLTFAEFVQYGRDNGANIVGGMPWSFQFHGYAVTHEDDRTYLLMKGSTSLRFTANDALRITISGDLYVLPRNTPIMIGGDFGSALEALRMSKRVAREGWNGKGMWLALQVPDAGSKMSRPYIYMRTADGALVPWVASQSDLIQNDWILVE